MVFCKMPCIISGTVVHWEYSLLSLLSEVHTAGREETPFGVFPGSPGTSVEAGLTSGTDKKVGSQKSALSQTAEVGHLMRRESSQAGKVSHGAPPNGVWEVS